MRPVHTDVTCDPAQMDYGTIIASEHRPKLIVIDELYSALCSVEGSRMAREMRNKFLAARLYRERAEELRTIADGLSRDLERDLLISIANDYDRQAKSAEARGRAALTAGLY